MSVEDPSRPWLSLYGDRPTSIRPPYQDALTMALAGLREIGEAPLVRYFDTAISGTAIERDAEALARALAVAGIASGDRVLLQLQNTPQFLVAMIGVWRLGAVIVPANPMYRQRELRHIAVDAGVRAFVVQDDLWADVGRDATRGLDLALVTTTSGLDGLGDAGVPAPLADVVRGPAEDAVDLSGLIEAHRSGPLPDVPPDGERLAMLVYTSGTTGPPKGAMTTHRSVVFSAATWKAWTGLERGEPVIAMAPAFHITGIITGLVVPLLVPSPVVLGYRFHPGETIRLIERHRPRFGVAAITAYTAMTNDPAFADADLSGLEIACSGGAPVAPRIVERWRAGTGVYIRNCYGLTESTTVTHFTPPHLEAPVDDASGALSVGVPVFDTHAEIRGPDGATLPPGELGELVVRGPQIAAGYFGKPEETAHALPDGELHTGDIAFMDAEGWFYIVDRSKDMIVASGFKVWPREVEDVLVEHPAVLEAAVVGVPDDYRGETVRAFVALRDGTTASAEELVAHARERLAAYKAPREVRLVDEVPKTPTGKILRRELRGPS